jgi:AraC-like DNA-binding protein
MQIELPNYHLQDIVRAIAIQMNVPSRNDCMEETLDLPEAYGSGKICGFTFGNSLSLMIFYGELKEELELTFSSGVPPLQFHFMIEGEMQHSLNDGTIRYQLLPLQGSITANIQLASEHFFLPAHQPLLFTKLLVDRAEYLVKIDCLVDEMPETLMQLFSDVEATQSFIYQSNYSIATAEIIKRIVQDKNEGLVRSTFIEGKALELLARQIKQFNDDLLSPGNQVVLREYDVRKIEAAREILMKNLKEPPTIEELARMAGINRQKLKSGFKRLFGTTINAYVRSERLDMASLLLLSGKSVLETSRAVGYTNQSHFAQRFREKFGMLPKDYLKSVQKKING